MKDAGFAGDSNDDLLYSMMFLSSVNAIGNFIGLSLSSRYGRRELIMKSMIPMAMGIALVILAIAMAVNATMSSPATR
jgi:MFS family permease